jgi:hypothetical protein
MIAILSYYYIYFTFKYFCYGNVYMITYNYVCLK